MLSKIINFKPCPDITYAYVSNLASQLVEKLMPFTNFFTLVPDFEPESASDHDIEKDIFDKDILDEDNVINIDTNWFPQGIFSRTELQKGGFLIVLKKLIYEQEAYENEIQGAVNVYNREKNEKLLQKLTEIKDQLTANSLALNIRIILRLIESGEQGIKTAFFVYSLLDAKTKQNINRPLLVKGIAFDLLQITIRQIYRMWLPPEDEVITAVIKEMLADVHIQLRFPLKENNIKNMISSIPEEHSNYLKRTALFLHHVFSLLGNERTSNIITAVHAWNNHIFTFLLFMLFCIIPKKEYDKLHSFFISNKIVDDESQANSTNN